jgi:hypothetical protein
MDKPQEQGPETKPKTKKAPRARRYLGGGGGTLPIGEGPHVVATDEGIARVQEHPGEIPGTSPDLERSPSRGGWQF